jgi:hypothetical protein
MYLPLLRRAVPGVSYSVEGSGRVSQVCAEHSGCQASSPGYNDLETEYHFVNSAATSLRDSSAPAVFRDHTAHQGRARLHDEAMYADHAVRRGFGIPIYLHMQRLVRRTPQLVTATCFRASALGAHAVLTATP